MSRPATDLSNGQLARVVGGALAAGLVAALAFGVSSAAWAQPGSPILQSLAIAGAVLLLASFVAVLAKRVGRPGKAGFHAHVGLASVGLACVLAHWSFHVVHFPTLLLVLLAGLVALGAWSRGPGAVAMANTFGRKPVSFAAPSPETRARLGALIAEKQARLARLDPQASEATFSLQPRHWWCSPGQALAYHRLCAEELRLTGATASLSPAQRHWRLVHRLLAWTFIAGLALHVVLVLFFAGYVAEGRAITWWRFADWDF